MKKAFSIFIICFYVAFPLISQIKILKNDENSDIAILNDIKNYIEHNHPAPYINIPKEEFEKHIENLKKKWNKKTLDEKYFSLRQLIALIKDSHTTIHRNMKEDKFLPFFILPYGKHSIIVQAESEYKELAGKELIAINGFKVNAILEKLFPIISYDKEGWARLQAHYECRIFSNLKYINVAKKDKKITIKYKDIPSGKIKTMKVDFLPFAPLNNPVFATLSATLFQKGYYSANLLEDMLFIQYNICFDHPDMPMKNFAQRIKEVSGIKKIIVDLRHNSGGNSNVISPLFSVLKDLKEKENIKLFVLIGNNTFSSGVMAAADLKKIGAMLIGEDVGWNGMFGEVKEIQLNTEYTLFCSIKTFLRIQELTTLHPDIVIVQDLKDLSNGLDTCIEYIKKL